MIECRIHVDDEGVVTGYLIKGHSGYGPSGHDIVCAAVSALGQATLSGLETVARLEPSVTMEEGFLECLIPRVTGEDKGRAAQILLQALQLGLRQIENEYPEHVRVMNVSGDQTDNLRR